MESGLLLRKKERMDIREQLAVSDNVPTLLLTLEGQKAQPITRNISLMTNSESRTHRAVLSFGLKLTAVLRQSPGMDSA